MDAHRRFDVVAAVGLLCWVGVSALVSVSAVSLTGLPTATLAILLAVFVVVPLVARLSDLPFRTGGRSRWYRAASFCTLPSAVAVLGSLALPTGPTATLLALPWVLVTGSLAVFGVQRSLPNTGRLAELALGVALLYLPVAGVALVAHRAGVTFGFGATTMLLTVVHFHYAGCALPAFCGLVGRESGESRTYRALVAVVLVGPGIIGLGIALSPAVELLSASVFGVVVAGVALHTFVTVAPERGIGHACVTVAAVAVAVSMGIVVAYVATRTTAVSLVTFETMLRGHGWLNAVGFALIGLVGWRMVDPDSTAPPLGMPVSRVTSRGRVGPDYLNRNDLTTDGSATGMVDSFHAFDSSSLDADRIRGDVTGFYERTAAYDLRVESTWERGFRLGSRLFDPISRRVGQLNLPVDGRDPDRLSSRIVPVADSADGRENVRAWIRTYDETGAAIYVALYATHRLDGRPYMNIAFPLPASNLTSVLTVEPLATTDRDGVVLSTVEDGPGDAGIYLRTPLGPLRLPLDETIRVWAPDGDRASPDGGDGDGAALVARHDVTLFGRRFLRLDYRIAATRELRG